MIWKITQLDVVPTESDFDNVIVTAHWECIGLENVYSARVYGTVSLPAPSNDFTPYNELTLDEVLQWVWANGVDKDVTETNVTERINQQINPPVKSMPLPWTDEIKALFEEA